MHDKFIPITALSAEIEPYHAEFLYGDLSKVKNSDMADSYVEGHTTYLRNLREQRLAGGQEAKIPASDMEIRKLVMQRIIQGAGTHVGGEKLDQQMERFLEPFRPVFARIISEQGIDFGETL